MEELESLLSAIVQMQTRAFHDQCHIIDQKIVVAF